MRRAILCSGLAVLFAVTNSSIRFEDTAAQAGIRANLQCGGPEKKWIPEANGSGCAAFDYDNDGLLDLLIVNGTTMDRLRQIVQGRIPTSTNSGIYLYRNLGKGGSKM